MSVFPNASSAVTITSDVTPATIGSVMPVTVSVAAVPGVTVIVPVFPVTDPVVAVIVGVSAAFVSVKPATVTAPKAKVSVASAGFVGAVLSGAFVASQVQTRATSPVTRFPPSLLVFPCWSTAVTVTEKDVPATSVPPPCVTSV